VAKVRTLGNTGCERHVSSSMAQATMRASVLPHPGPWIHQSGHRPVPAKLHDRSAIWGRPCVECPWHLQDACPLRKPTILEHTCIKPAQPYRAIENPPTGSPSDAECYTLRAAAPQFQDALAAATLHRCNPSPASRSKVESKDQLLPRRCVGDASGPPDLSPLRRGARPAPAQASQPQAASLHPPACASFACLRHWS
jgi:hypothetical protein